MGEKTVIGERIREIRHEKGMTSKELAEKANVTQGYISQIERDIISPSMSVLSRISAALDAPLVALLAQQEQDTVNVIKKNKRTKIKFADVNLEYDFLTPYGRDKSPAAQMEVVEYRLAPKSWGSNDVMLHPECAECSFVLEGTLEYHVGNEIYTIHAGDCLYLPPAIPHQLYNPGDVGVRVLGVITPPCF